MPAPSDWTIAVITLSESFAGAVAALLEESGARAVACAPDADLADADAVLWLAGGAERLALDAMNRGAGDGRPMWVVGAAPDHRLAAALLQHGATDYFALPADYDLLRRTLERAARGARGRADATVYAAEERAANGFDAMVGDSDALRQTIGLARRVAAHRDVSVLIGGETGTGKELLARGIHYESARAAAPFVEINCTAIPATLLESELFGHERGAFTGAIAAKPGLFEAAHGGTVFLDEIGHLPIDLQPKLLRALETRQIRRVGGQEIRTIDVRVIAATHVDLAAAVRQGAFREDLYYRLNVVTLTLPPLRERPGDVVCLAGVFAARIAARYGLPAPAFSAAVRRALEAHTWPGNVRELRNAIERALVLSAPGTIDPDELPAAAGAITTRRSAEAPLPFPAPLAAITRAAVRAMLKRTGGNKSEAARQLGISRPRLQRLLEGRDDTED